MDLTQRMADWCSGGPKWLDGAPHVHRVFLQADLRSGELAISVGGWTNAAIVRVPELAADLDARPWHPAVILTGVGQQARLLDFQVAFES